MKPDIPPIAVCRSAGYGVNADKEKERKNEQWNIR